MAEGRDRLERQIDFASLFLNRQRGRIFVDDETTWRWYLAAWKASSSYSSSCFTFKEGPR
ncbi:unnamed protein product [Brassica oleracea var. botrytis]|uniref:Uncharacterized protein n=1 Tax=Brassica oleracea TaxID=3712 RepID=A0A3P6DWH7_BRAOL|nr:unnamed protein product [Brassica oleracea]